jgi:hypothetical protein
VMVISFILILYLLGRRAIEKRENKTRKLMHVFGVMYLGHGPLQFFFSFSIDIMSYIVVSKLSYHVILFGPVVEECAQKSKRPVVEECFFVFIDFFHRKRTLVVVTYTTFFY